MKTNLAGAQRDTQQCTVIDHPNFLFCLHCLYPRLRCLYPALSTSFYSSLSPSPSLPLIFFLSLSVLDLVFCFSPSLFRLVFLFSPLHPHALGLLQPSLPCSVSPVQARYSEIRKGRAGSVSVRSWEKSGGGNATEPGKVNGKPPAHHQVHYELDVHQL